MGDPFEENWFHFVVCGSDNFFVSAITASNAGFGLQLPSNRSGLPLARQEFASFAPQNVTIFTELRCLRKARKIPAYASLNFLSASLTNPPCVVAALSAISAPKAR